MKYIGFYGIESIENRRYVLSATNKMNYISNVLNNIGHNVEIISPSWSDNKEGFYKGKKVNLSEFSTLKTFSTFGSNIKILRKLNEYFVLLQLTLYLLLFVKKKENIIVYHSLALCVPITIIKKIKKIRIILEVEEIYADISNNNQHRYKEYKMYKNADAFIFPTELLNDKLNKEFKPSAITYGTYKVEDDRYVKFDDDKIHVVYAGTLDPRKGGITAVQAAEYLDDNYHIHILGFGNEDQKQLLKDKIKEISRITKCIVTYDGLYRDEDYIRFLQKCHIGLSTQSSTAEYNDTSFPSKVLSYMANGLRVVSIRIKALEKAEISDLLYYYDKDCPKEIANAIKNIDLSDKYNSREKIRTLDRKFMQDIKKLMEKINE